MKYLNTIQTISKIGKILSKVAFVFSVIGFCGCVVGLISLGFGSESVIKIGGTTLHGIFSGNYDSINAAAATLSGWIVVCAGEAVLTKFAEAYFTNELNAGTPFTAAGAKEMLRLGILTAAIPTGCAVIGSIVEGVAAGFANAENAAVMDMYFDNESSIVIGVMFIVISLLLRCGVELMQNKNVDSL